jgi:hypothetical protein
VVGAGFDLTNTVVMILPIGLASPISSSEPTRRCVSARRNLAAFVPLISAAASDGPRRHPHTFVMLSF